MAPLANAKVVPAGWSRHHQRTATGGMNAVCTITDPARAVEAPMDPVTGVRPAPTPFVIVAGVACRVQRTDGQPSATVQGQEASTEGTYLVQLDDPNLSTLPKIVEGYLVTVTAAVNDPHLVGLGLVITESQSGSERFTRDLSCILNNQPGTAA